MPYTRKSPSKREEREATYRNWDAYETEDRDTDTAYEDLIQKDQTVCDNCFQKCYEAVSHEWWRGTFGWSDFNHWIPYPTKVTEIPAPTAAQGTRLTCANCGHRNTQIRPVPKRHLNEYLDNLIETLRLKGIDVSPTSLRETAWDRNVPENQGKQDQEVFKPAVSAGIRGANMEPSDAIDRAEEVQHG